MPTSHFTIVSNVVIRDREVHHGDLGALVRLLSHRNGWKTSTQAVAHENSIGKGAAATALQHLETTGYLLRTQERSSTGTMGAWTYLVTDDPAALTAHLAQNHTSAPEPENPDPATHRGRLRAAARKPSVTDRPGPATSSAIVASARNSTSAPEPENPDPAGRLAAAAREESAAAGRPAGRRRSSPGTALLVQAAREHRVRLVGRVLTEQAAVADSLLEAGVDAEEIRTTLAWPLVDQDGVPVERPAAVVAYRLRQLAPPITSLPAPRTGRERWTPWCGECDQRTRQIEKDEGDGDGPRPARCPACHPAKTGVYF